MNMETSKTQAGAADKFRSVLSRVLPNLLDKVDCSSKMDKVKQALGEISKNYKTGLSKTLHRSNWDDAANRCAYVFLYLVHHCHLVYYSPQSWSDLKEANRWGDLKELKVCSIGGGPGSDLVGLATFLRHDYNIPPMLDCLVLDLYPNWKQAWDAIARFLPGKMHVDYSRCDLVRDARLQPSDRQFVQDADIITLVKSFSAVSAFFRNDKSHGVLLHTILREIKPGCHVLFIDNDHNGDTLFQNDFATPAGLELVFEKRGKQTMPCGSYSDTVQVYRRALGRRPMRYCDVNIQLYRKERPMKTEECSHLFGINNGIQPLQITPQHPSSNGLAKRAFLTLKSGVKKNRDVYWKKKLKKLLSYRKPPRPITGRSVSELLCRRQLRTKLDPHRRRMKDKTRKYKTRCLQPQNSVLVEIFSSGPKSLDEVKPEENIPRLVDHTRLCNPGPQDNLGSKPVSEVTVEEPAVQPMEVPGLSESETTTKTTTETLKVPFVVLELPNKDRDVAQAE